VGVGVGLVRLEMEEQIHRVALVHEGGAEVPHDVEDAMDVDPVRQEVKELVPRTELVREDGATVLNHVEDGMDVDLVQKEIEQLVKPTRAGSRIWCQSSP
jgi:hypothetical protein